MCNPFLLENTGRSQLCQQQTWQKGFSSSWHVLIWQQMIWKAKVLNPNLPGDRGLRFTNGPAQESHGVSYKRLSVWHAFCEGWLVLHSHVFFFPVCQQEERDWSITYMEKFSAEKGTETQKKFLKLTPLVRWCTCLHCRTFRPFCWRPCTCIHPHLSSVFVW